MIAAVFGEKLIAVEDGLQVVSGTLVYHILCSNRCSYQLRALHAQNAQGTELGQPVAISTRMEVDDSSIVLVGFSTRQRKDLYEKLRSVPGIGRSSALAILDCGEEIDTLRAISSSDVAYFKEVPRLGIKKIETLIETFQRKHSGALPAEISVPVRQWVIARDQLIADMSFEDAESKLRTAADGGASTAAELLA